MREKKNLKSIFFKVQKEYSFRQYSMYTQFSNNKIKKHLQFNPNRCVK